jgi:ribonuclease BN (tRNA processing enzyme)
VIDNSIVNFVQGSNVLIHDSQYMPLEKKGSKSGWGHSSWEDAVLTAKGAKVKKLFLFHHDPEKTEEELKAILEDAKKVFRHTEIAMESKEYEIG